jgi:L-iditol 2-dehydrogenase
MLALVLHGPDDLRLEEVPDPRPGPGEVVIAVEAALTCATDAKMMRAGAHPALPALPAPFGHEAAGRVAAIGPGADVAIGQRVVPANSAPCGRCDDCRRGHPALCPGLVHLSGAFAPRLRVPAAIVAVNLVPIPDGLPSAVAAMAEPLACAVRAVSTSAARDGDHALVIGAGVQGLFLTMLLALRGCRVVVADPNPDRRARALAWGAEEVVAADRSRADAERLRSRTPGGRGGEIVFEAVGRPEAWATAIAAARPGGEVTLYGGCPPGSEVALPAGAVHYSELTIRGSYHHSPDAFRDAVGLLAASPARFGGLLEGPIALREVSAALRGGGGVKQIVDVSAS